MEVLYRRCCGIDVHKKFLVACLLILLENGQVHKEIRRFSTMTGDLRACIDWLKEGQCLAIAMESTGVYWQPPFNLMEGQFEQVMIVNAEHLKGVPGQKTKVLNKSRQTLQEGVFLAHLRLLSHRFQRKFRAENGICLWTRKGCCWASKSWRLISEIEQGARSCSNRWSESCLVSR